MEGERHSFGVLDFVRYREGGRQGKEGRKGEDRIFWGRGCGRMHSSYNGMVRVGMCVGASVTRRDRCILDRGSGGSRMPLGQESTIQVEKIRKKVA